MKHLFITPPKKPKKKRKKQNKITKAKNDAKGYVVSEEFVPN